MPGLRRPLRTVTALAVVATGLASGPLAARSMRAREDVSAAPRDAVLPPWVTEVLRAPDVVVVRAVDPESNRDDLPSTPLDPGSGCALLREIIEAAGVPDPRPLRLGADVAVVATRGRAAVDIHVGLDGRHVAFRSTGHAAAIVRRVQDDGRLHARIRTLLDAVDPRRDDQSRALPTATLDRFLDVREVRIAAVDPHDTTVLSGLDFELEDATPDDGVLARIVATEPDELWTFGTTLRTSLARPHFVVRCPAQISALADLTLGDGTRWRVALDALGCGGNGWLQRLAPPDGRPRWLTSANATLRRHVLSMLAARGVVPRRASDPDWKIRITAETASIARLAHAIGPHLREPPSRLVEELWSVGVIARGDLRHEVAERWRRAAVAGGGRATTSAPAWIHVREGAPGSSLGTCR